MHYTDELAYKNIGWKDVVYFLPTYTRKWRLFLFVNLTDEIGRIISVREHSSITRRYFEMIVLSLDHTNSSQARPTDSPEMNLCGLD